MIYLPSFDFSSGWVPTAGIRSDYFTITGVHEIGHAFGNLVDEYLSYETQSSGSKPVIGALAQESNNKFRNNCFDKYETTEFSSSTLKGSSPIFSHLFHLDTSTEIEQIFFPKGTEEVDQTLVLDFSFQVTPSPLNPWTHLSKVPYSPHRDDPIKEEDGFIPNYDGSLYAGCNGGKSFPGTENSIMNYILKYTFKTWEKS